MTKYETVAIYSVTAGEEATAAVAEKMKALIEANATLESVDDWGTRHLAYPINKETDGNYVLYNFESDVNFPAELDRVANITDGVLRILTTKKED